MKTITKNLVLTRKSGFEKPILGKDFQSGSTAKFFKPAPEGIEKRPDNYYRNMNLPKLLTCAGAYCEAMHVWKDEEIAGSNKELKDELERRGYLPMDVIGKAKILIAEGKITGKQEFERKHTRFYQKCCKLNVTGKLGLPERKKRDKKYDLKTDDELIGEAVGHMKEEETTLIGEFARKHRYLYDELNRRGLMDRKELREIMMINADLYLEKRHEFFLGENSLG